MKRLARESRAITIMRQNRISVLFRPESDDTKAKAKQSEKKRRNQPGKGKGGQTNMHAEIRYKEQEYAMVNQSIG